MSETTSYPYETRLNIHCQQGEVIDELALTDAGYLAEILAAIDEADRALKELDSAIAKEPAVRAVALNNIALVYLMDKRFTEAEDCLQRALALVDGASLLCEPQVAANYAFLLRQTGRKRAAAAAQLRRRNFPPSAVAKLDHGRLTPAKLIHWQANGMAEQRMHAGLQVRSVKLPPEIQPVFLSSAARPLTEARRGPGRVPEAWPRTLESDVVHADLRKRHAISVDCHFRISQAKKLADQIFNAREARKTGPGFALSLEEERQPKIWKSRVTNCKERLIATMSVTLFALFEKRRMNMEIRDPQEFVRYFGKIHQRTMNVVGAIPPGKVDWGFRPDKFTLGDLVRHIAASNRYIFLEVAKGNRSTYHGCGKEYGASYDEIVAFAERLHREAIETLSHFTTEGLQRRCTTPDGASIPVWKWLRSMVEHEIHHRGQIYIYLSLLETPAPPIYGLTSEQARERSVRSS